MPFSIFPINYQHTATEMYEDANHNLKQCNASGEDPTCINQWNTFQKNNDDHVVYLGQRTQCGSSAFNLLEN